MLHIISEKKNVKLVDIKLESDYIIPNIHSCLVSLSSKTSWVWVFWDVGF